MEVFVTSSFYAPAAEMEILGVFSTLDAAIDCIKKQAKCDVVIKTGNGNAYINYRDTCFSAERFQLDK